jgi:ELP3 family radical SAM enzyme/protein acetyltransferase
MSYISNIPQLPKAQDIETFCQTHIIEKACEDGSESRELVMSMLDIILSQKLKFIKISGNKEIRKVMKKLQQKPFKMQITVTKNVIRKMMQLTGYDIKYPEVFQSFVKKQMRSESGVIVCSILTSPHPEYNDPETGDRMKQEFSCKHDCYYCPNEPAHEGNNMVPQPRSYLTTEPAVMRANHNKFDAVRQMYDRLMTYRINGHPLDKLEVIVLGGTLSNYPKSYVREFCRDIYYSANTFLLIGIDDFKQIKEDEDEGKIIMKTFELKRPRMSLEEEMHANEMATNGELRIIGLTLETRPDEIDIDEIRRFREYGCTRVQLGIQHTNNSILKKVNRGHTIEDSIRAIALLKQNCFKVDIHLMPNLPGASIDMDKEMFARVMTDSSLQVDQWKIYPCSVVPWTVIKKWHESGKYKPYGDKELFDMLYDVKLQIPQWIRINRLVRDIPEGYISGGCSTTNMRQALHIALEKNGERCRCIRCREIKGTQITSEDFENSVLNVRWYKDSNGTEYFLSYESPDNTTIYGFLRLRLPNGVNGDNITHDLFEVLYGKALIRELHVYGKVSCVGESKSNNQHFGFGKKLMKAAEEIAIDKGFNDMAVISGNGVREYYRKQGYVLCDTYMIKTLDFNTNKTGINNTSGIGLGLGLGLGLGFGLTSIIGISYYVYCKYKYR